VVAACERDGIAIGVARASDRVRESLRRSGLEARIGEKHFYPAVDSAVTALAGPSAR
jgi:MFS superfamily sulfate permease-like transporter